MRPTDAELLGQWRTTRDAGAFAELISRHSAMVYGTGKRILGDASRAEAVAKACFDALTTTEWRVKWSVGGWLHQCAVQQASLLFGGVPQNGAVTPRDGAVTPRDGAVTPQERHGVRVDRRTAQLRRGTRRTAETAWKEIRPCVDGAIAELPERLREPIVLRFLEAQPQSAIAQDLGIPRASVEDRLEKGLERTAKSLSKRGISVAPSMLAAFMAANAIEATPASLAATLGGLSASAGRGQAPAKAGVAEGRDPTAGAGGPRARRMWRRAVVAAGLTVVGLALAVGYQIGYREGFPPAEQEGAPRSVGAIPGEAAEAPAARASAAVPEPATDADSPMAPASPAPEEAPAGGLPSSLLEALREQAETAGGDSRGEAAEPLRAEDIPPQNGAHYFLLAAELFPEVDRGWLATKWEEVRRHGWSEDAELRAFLANCRPALDAIRTGLATGHASLPQPRGPNESMPYLKTYRDLTRVMTIEAQMYAAEGDYTAALDNYLALLDFANESARGGVMANGLAAYSISEQAAQGLREILDWAAAGPEDYRLVIERMQQLDEGVYSSWEMAAAEAQGYGEWIDTEAGSGQDVRQMLLAASQDAVSARILASMSDEELESVFRESLAEYPALMEYLALPYYEAQETDPNSLMADNLVNDLVLWAFLRLQTTETRVHAVVRGNMLMAAVLLYYLDNGAYPESLEDLAPRYLAVLPVDPFSGGFFAYSPTNFGYLLFSAGADRKNNRGVMDAWDVYGADLVLHRK